jgi:hypothetical protein
MCSAEHGQMTHSASSHCCHVVSFLNLNELAHSSIPSSSPQSGNTAQRFPCFSGLQIVPQKSKHQRLQAARDLVPSGDPSRSISLSSRAHFYMHRCRRLLCAMIYCLPVENAFLLPLACWDWAVTKVSFALRGLDGAERGSVSVHMLANVMLQCCGSSVEIAFSLTWFMHWSVRSFRSTAPF